MIAFWIWRKLIINNTRGTVTWQCDGQVWVSALESSQCVGNQESCRKHSTQYAELCKSIGIMSHLDSKPHTHISHDSKKPAEKPKPSRPIDKTILYISNLPHEVNTVTLTSG